MGWLKESNRLWHFWGGFLIGLVFGFITSIVVAAVLEIKDLQYNDWNSSAWDWKDFWATILGGFLGKLSVVILISSIFFFAWLSGGFLTML